MEVNKRLEQRTKVLAADEGLRGRNDLSLFILCYVHCSKVTLTSIHPT